MRGEIINEVLTVEERALRIVRDAERTARDILTDAQTEANEIVRSSLKQERERCHARLLEAEAEAEARLAEFETGLQDTNALQDKDIDRIALAIVEMVCKTELDGQLER